MSHYSLGARLVHVVRSGITESVHTGHLVVLDPAGTTLRWIGAPEQPIYPRSTLKPLQAVGMLTAGLECTAEELALACASHTGSERHRALVLAALAASGLDESALGCPPELPLGEAERRAFLAAGLDECRVAMNCSGKHAAMLRTCLANGWPLDGYLAPDHPLQVRLRATVEELTGEQVAHVGVDGCGAPLFALPLTGLGRAYARLATATSGPERQVADAMRAHPALVEGEQETVTRLMTGIPGLLAKDGAEGVFAAATSDGLVVALKIDDGAARAAEAAVVHALLDVGVRADALTPLAEPPVLGGGRPVGRLEPASRD